MSVHFPLSETLTLTISWMVPVIPSDYSSQLTALLRYPPLPSQSQEPVIRHTNLLLRQALYIRLAPDVAVGVNVVMENRDALAIPAEPPEPRPQPRRLNSRTPPTRGGRPASAGVGADLRRDVGGLQDLIASRLFDGTSAVFSTVSELRVGHIMIWQLDQSADKTRLPEEPTRP